MQKDSFTEVNIIIERTKIEIRLLLKVSFVKQGPFIKGRVFEVCFARNSYT
ncbi:hypothetical protein NBRC116601_15300 [Cognatishimia sp. WU-CL00825]